MVVDDHATVEIERKQPCGACPVVAMVDGPEPTVAVDGDTEHGVEQLRLLANVRIGHCGTVDELEQLVARGPCFRMHREKHTARLVDRDVSDRQPVGQHFFQRFLLQDRCARQIRIRLSTAVTNPGGSGRRNQYCQ